MSWPTMRLSEVADFRLGKMLDQRKNKGDLLPYLANKNVRWGEFDFSEMREMRFEERELETFSLKNGDIVMCEGGVPGRCAIWRDQLPKMMYQKALHRIRPFETMNEVYLYYNLSHRAKSGHFEGLFTGSTIKHLPKEKLALVEVDVPDLPTQERIAAILSAYDDLIENNRRRIALLEQAARLLYREWFVHFRFPGHETAKFVDGLPEGWEIKTLTELAEHVDYGFTASANHEVDGPRFLRITDIAGGNINWSSVPRCAASEKETAKYLLTEGDVVVARTGATTGWARRIGKTEEAAIFASYLVRFRFNERLDSTVAGVFMQSETYKSQIKGKLGGAAQPNASAKVLGNVDIVVPTEKIQDGFKQQALASFQQIDCLMHTNIKLTRARDLLLPRLMDGRLPV